jgi:hypothetical protein
VAAITFAIAPPAEKPATSTRLASTDYFCSTVVTMPSMIEGSPEALCMSAGTIQFHQL